LEEGNDRSAILRTAKDRAMQSEEQQRLHMIADAIGERRDRDLLDILSQIEQERGWSEVVEHLVKARKFVYTLPVGVGPFKTEVEPLKFREMLFAMLGCTGLEPVSISTSELLDWMKDKSSLAKASVSAHAHIESIVKKQVETGDTLFFNADEFGNQITEGIRQIIERAMNKGTRELALEKKNDKINISLLWQCETSRAVLSELGIKGNLIDLKQMDEVLSVIQFSIPIKNVKQFSSQTKSKYPSNTEYNDLHHYIVTHDIQGICSLSSRHSIPTLRFILQKALDDYNTEPSSDKYRQVVNLIHMHVRIRTPDSIQFLESLMGLKDLRIATAAITALGNYYNESAAAALTELLCKSRNREIVKTTVSAISNVGKKCPETYLAIMTNLESPDCRQKGKLRRLLNDLVKKQRLYY
jgi:hypothetical protein